MAAVDYMRRVKAAPAPSAPVSEAGLTALKHLTKALGAGGLPPARLAALLGAVAGTLEGVAPLRLFDDFAPAHAPPEAPLVVTEAQVTADSTRSGGTYNVMQAFASLAPPAPTDAAAKTYWCSRARPAGGKSSLTARFGRPEQLTGLYLALPEAKVCAESVGLEVLTAPASGVTSAEAIAEYVSNPKAKWTTLGVLPSKDLLTGRRLPAAAAAAVALRISFKDYASGNSEKFHSLTTAIVYVASNALRQGVGGTTQYTDAAAVLHTLATWFRHAATPAPGAAAPAPDLAAAALRALSGLTLATGSLDATLALVDGLLAHEAPLPAPLADRLRGLVRAIDDRFDTVGAACAGGAGSAPAAAANPERTAEAKFTDKSSNVTIVDGETAHRVRSESSPEYAALNIGISKGRMAWEIKIVEDSRDGECHCFGVCKKPVTSSSYDSSSDMWVWRAYNGQLYERGSATSSKARYHPDDIVRFELDMDVGELRASLNGADQGVLFSNLHTSGWTLYPVVQFYSSGRVSELLRVWVYDNAGGGAGGSGAPSAAPSYLCNMRETADETVAGGSLGKGATLSVPAEEGGSSAADGGDRPMRPATLHGTPVRYGLAVPLAADAGEARVVYKLGTAPDEGDKKKKDRGAPSPYTHFEAVVGIADFVAAEAGRSSRSGGGGGGGGGGASYDEDSKVESSAEHESKDAEPAPRGGATESKDDGDVSDAGGATTITFRVKGDGKQLWASPPVAVPADGVANSLAAYARLPVFHCTLDIKDVNSLELVVETSGKTKNVWAMWGDAAVAVAPWVSARVAYESEMAATSGGALPSDVVPTAEVVAAAAAGAAAGAEPATAPCVMHPLRALVTAPAASYVGHLLAKTVTLTGPVAAAALLRELQLFAREAYKPVRVSRPAPAFGEEAVPLEVPFVVQADGRVLVAFARTLSTLAARVRRAGAGAATSIYAEMLEATLLLLKGNLRRIVAARVLPADVGVVLPDGAGGDKARAAAPELARYGPTLVPVLEVLNGLMAPGSGIPAGVASAAGGVLDAGLPLFYPTAAAQATFLADLMGKGEGGVLEVHFAWPTLLKNSDAPAAAAVDAAIAAAAAAASKDGGAAGGADAKRAALPAPLAVLNDGSDPRFERALLALQAYATRRHLKHATVGAFGKFMHVIMTVPDEASYPLLRTLSTVRTCPCVFPRR